MDIQKFWLLGRQTETSVARAQEESREKDISDSFEELKEHRLGTVLSYAEIMVHNDDSKIRRKKPDCLYVIAASANECAIPTVKIGITSNIEKRFSAIQAHSPVKCHLAFLARVEGINVRVLEGKIHNLLANRVAHGEWFRINHYDAIRCVRDFFSSESIEFDEVDISTCGFSVRARRVQNFAIV